MKYIKTYEQKNILQIGDYVLVTTDGDDDRLDNEICKIVRKKPYFYYVELPGYVGEYRIYPNEIIKKLTKEEVDLYLNAKKYNI